MAVRLLVAASFLSLIALAGCSEESVSVEVAVHGSTFDPASITVASGDSVVFVNHDSFRHTATADGGAFDVDLAGDGGEGKVKVSAGTYPYHCKLHPSMRGTLVVT